MINCQNHRACSLPLMLLGALLFWLLSPLEPAQSLSLNEIDILIPVDPYKLPEGLTLAGPALKEIEIRVKGTPEALEALRRNVPRYPLDLSAAAVGVESVAIDPHLIPMPAGIQITRVNPAYLSVRVDRLVKKQVPVRVAISGEPASSYSINGTTAEPSMLFICGPKTAVDLIDEIFTKPVDVSGRSETFKKEIAVDLAQGVETCSASGIVLAEIYLAAKVATRRFEGIWVQGRNTPYEFSISPPTLSLEIKGPLNIINNLQPSQDIEVYVELENLKPGVYVRRAAISLPVKTTLVSVEPEVFTVKIIGDEP